MSSTVRTITAMALTFMLFAGVSVAENGAPSGLMTFSKDVAPILYQNCIHCHRPGEVAPMSLRTFEETRPWAKSIKTMVSTGKMPPWFADPAHGEFANDSRLSEAEIATIVKWVDQGAREGDPADLPELPEMISGWQLGEPDFIVDLPEVTIPADGEDYFPDLEFEINVPEKRWVRAVEVRPGNPAVNHHVVLFSSGNGMGSSGFFDVLAVWAVGTPPTVYPEGMGRWVVPGQRINTNMHYHPNGTETTDQTRLGLYFGEGEIQKEISAALAGSMTFSIPAGAKSYPVNSSYIIDQDVRIVSYFPHMHLRGKSMTLTANYPGGEKDILLNVPEYDFNWQLFYYPEEPVYLPRGTRVDIAAVYDNSADNPHNPDPTRDVGFGLNTTDEMMFGMFEFVPVEGASMKSANTESRVQALLDTLPPNESYAIEMKIGRDTPTALHLPKNGDGTWYIPFQRQLMSVPVTNVQWDGDQFTFDLAIIFGEMKTTLHASGTLTQDGQIQGGFDTSGRSFLPVGDFSGALASD